MAEEALALNNNWGNRNSQNDQMVADLLRQQKNQEQARQANAETIKSQMAGSNSVNERLASRVPEAQPTKVQGALAKSVQLGSKQDTQDIAEALQHAKQMAKQIADHPTPVGVIKAVNQEGREMAKKLRPVLMRRVTAELLKQSWANLLDSYGLTLIYLNIHAWFGFIEGHKIFCKLGEEIKAPATAQKFMGFLEMIGIILLDFIVLLIILCIISFISWFIGVVSHPINTLWGVLFPSI